MTTPRSRRSALILPLLLAFVAAGVAYLVKSSPATGALEADDKQFSRYVDEKGKITLPAEYQTTFLHLGTFSVAGSESSGELHGVYARPEDVQAYRREGKFPDGAVLVKDVHRTESEGLTTGHTSWATDVKVWFVMIKDSQGRFDGNDLWGDGWGWALFDGKDPETQIAADYRTDCRPCHIPARRDDWLYVRGYPLLHKKRSDG